MKKYLPSLSVIRVLTTRPACASTKRTTAKSIAIFDRELYTTPHFFLFLLPNKSSGWVNKPYKNGRIFASDIAVPRFNKASPTAVSGKTTNRINRDTGLGFSKTMIFLSLIRVDRW